MARFSRIVVPGVAHHVVQRGVRRMPVFFSDSDYRAYLSILARQAARHSLSIWTYCLMPNHVHLIVVPATEEGLSRPLGEAHRRYALRVNRRAGWTGHLWQERFSSAPMDEPHLWMAIRYVLLNPVRARLVAEATDWQYSSARAHVLGEPDRVVDPRPVAKRVGNWSEYLRHGRQSADEAQRIRSRSHIGRPLGSESFVLELEVLTGRRLRPFKVGRKPERK